MAALQCSCCCESWCWAERSVWIPGKYYLFDCFDEQDDLNSDDDSVPWNLDGSANIPTQDSYLSDEPIKEAVSRSALEWRGGERIQKVGIFQYHNVYDFNIDEEINQQWTIQWDCFRISSRVKKGGVGAKNLEELWSFEEGRTEGKRFQ